MFLTVWQMSMGFDSCRIAMRTGGMGRLVLASGDFGGRYWCEQGLSIGVGWWGWVAQGGSGVRI